MPIQAERTDLPVISVTGPDARAQAALVGEPIHEAPAAGLARVVKAPGDPVRLRLVSLIGAWQAAMPAPAI